MYYISSLTMGLLIVVMIYQYGRSKEWIVLVSIFMLNVLLRSIYLLSTGFSLIPLSDANVYYGVTKYFLEAGRVYLGTSTGPTIAYYASGWPLLYTLANSLATITHIDLFYVVILFPLLLSVLSLIFVYLFTRELVLNLNLKYTIVPLSLLFYAVSTDNIYASMQFTRQSLVIPLTVLIFYLMARTISTTRTANYEKISILFLIFMFSIVLSHDFTTFVLLLFLTFSFILPKIANRLLEKLKFKITVSSFRFVSAHIVVFFSVATFFWWLFFSPMILQTYLPFINFQISFSPYTDTLKYASTRSDFYSILQPQPYVNLLPISYMILFASLIVGFFVFIRQIFAKKRLNSVEQFLAYSLTVFLVIFLVFEFRLSLQPLRVLWLAAPLIAFFIAFLFNCLFSAKTKKFLWKSIAFSIPIIIIFSTFLSPWSRSFMPLYVYDPSIKVQDVGTHNPSYHHILPFLTNYINITNYRDILSDDDELLYSTLPATSFQHIQNVHWSSESIDNDNTIIFEFMNLNPSFSNLPYIQAAHPEVIQNLTSFKQQIADEYSMVYDDGSIRIRVLS